MAKRISVATKEKERFLAFEGLVQWTRTVMVQSARLSCAIKKMYLRDWKENFRENIQNFRSECHFFVISSYKLLEYRDWCLSFGLCQGVDFGEIDGFPMQDIKDLRNMREHIVDYFKGNGNAADRWYRETPDFKADASSVVEHSIGGRLDWVQFGGAAERLLARLLTEPIPYPT